MINCKDAKHLFGRYLDGQLSASLQTELHAHRLQCTECQNELALLEACGDVIALDRCEPRVSASFTDRVLLARRARIKPVRRPWTRTLVIYGSPLAAAACIALMFSIVQPIPVQLHSVTASAIEGPPQPIREVLIGERELSAQEKKELEATPAMSAEGFLDALVGPVVEKSRTTAEGARRSAENVLEALRQAISSEHEALVKQWRQAHPEWSSSPVGRISEGLDSTEPQDEMPAVSPSGGERVGNHLY